MTQALKCYLICRMQIGIRQFDNEVIEWFKLAATGSDYTRSGLARELCERSDWRNVKGQLCEAQARKRLVELAEELSITLPSPAPCPRSSLPVEYDDVCELECSLAQLGQITVSPVLPTQTKQWHSMMHTHHPRGAPRVPGAAIKYWVESDRYGRLGGLSFHAASWHEAARDKFIGWSVRARCMNLDRVLNNSRFLILPSVRVHGLASQVLSLARARIRDDWHQAYGRFPVLAYTYIDGAYTGACYQAARWRKLGETSGRKSSDAMPKQVYGIALCEQWKQILNTEPQTRFRAHRDVYFKDDAKWSDVEYGFSTHPDGRIRKRLVSMGCDWEKAAQDPTPQMFANEAKRKAAYRFISNDNVGMDDILESHRQATVARGVLNPVVLAVQDTTAVNYDTMKHSTDDLVKIGGTAKGVMVHASVAFSEGGRVLGVLDIDGQFRGRFSQIEELTESQRWVEGLETAVEYSAACGDTTRVVSVCDREGDVWEMFDTQHQNRDQVGLLVRCNGARQRRVIDGHGRSVALRSYVESSPVVAKRMIFIEEQGGKRARKARCAGLSLRVQAVSVKAPGKTRDTLSLTAVSVIEDAPPAGVKALNWLLLSSEGEADAQNALRLCHWYEARWGIEEYFRVFKAGCKVEKRQFDSTEKLVKCMAFDAVTAWRVFDLQRVAKHEPQLPADEVVEPEETEVLYALLHNIDPKRHSIRPPPDLRILEYVVDKGRLAGFRPTSRQPIPGTKILWRAHVKLKTSIQAFDAFRSMQRARGYAYED